MVIYVNICNLVQNSISMGYHVIIDPEDFPIKYTYVERTEKLVELEGINGKSIIFQGNRENPPQQVGTSVDFQRLSEDWYRAGLRAQAVFAKLARERDLVLEELSQDIESFKAYSRGIKGKVKRGDFLIRNRGNLEVEIKCRSFYGRGKYRYFFFSEEDLRKHLNMEQTTQTSVVVAVFQRKGDRPLEESLCMIKVDRIYELTKSVPRERKEYGWVYRIPLTETLPGFDLIAEYNQKEEVIDLFEEGYCLYADPEDQPYVLVAYYKNLQHLDWIIQRGLYNLRMGNDRGAICLGKKESSARYILLHTKGEKVTGKLFQILGDGPRVYSRNVLIRQNYPGSPAHDFYLVYRIIPVMEKELQNKSWDISCLEGYVTGHQAAFPFAVPLAELLK